MKIKLASLVIMGSLLLGACDAGKDGVVRDIKIDMSTEYKVPLTDIEVETIDYGVTKFTTKQLKVTIKSKKLTFYLVAKDGSGDNFRRIPINE